MCIRFLENYLLAKGLTRLSILVLIFHYFRECANSFSLGRKSVIATIFYSHWGIFEIEGGRKNNYFRLLSSKPVNHVAI